MTVQSTAIFVENDIVSLTQHALKEFMSCAMALSEKKSNSPAQAILPYIRENGRIPDPIYHPVF